MSTFVDIHVIQTVAASNLNRDDQGIPKTMHFGGIKRARLSSQSMKKAVRDDFLTHGAPTGVRTKALGELVGTAIIALDDTKSQEDANTLATTTLNAVGLKVKAPAKNSEEIWSVAEALAFLAPEQIKFLAQSALEADAEKDPAAHIKANAKTIRAGLNASHAWDMALFGRMVASDKTLNIDAACQVAHAMSVDKIRLEDDYFTAVDDVAEGSGAAMLGNVEFCASTFYRYANVNMDALTTNLGTPEAAAEATVQFVESFIKTLPSGKQASMASRTLPEFVLVQVREDAPVQHSGAFIVPITGDVSTNAIATLVERANATDEMYGTSPVFEAVAAIGEHAGKVSVPELLAGLLGSLLGA